MHAVAFPRRRVKADSDAGLISVQTQGTLEGTGGIHAPLSLSDPGLSVNSGSFTLTVEATRHDDVRDLGDAGTAAGEAVFTVTC